MKNTKLTSKAGFSLVEMLVVIAVIGILAAIAVPNIGRINGAATDSKNRRNAQQLASVCNAAQAAGLDFLDSDDDGEADLTDVATVVGLVSTGAKIDNPTSPFNGNFFGVPNMSATDQAGAVPYLGISEGLLVYNSGLSASDPAEEENP